VVTCHRPSFAATLWPVSNEDQNTTDVDDSIRSAPIGVRELLPNRFALRRYSKEITTPQGHLYK
jgi:hypothetical protein